MLLKNSFFGEIGEIFTITARPTFQGEGFGQIGLLPLMLQLTSPHGKSHPTFRDYELFPKNYDVSSSEFFNTIGSDRTFAIVLEKRLISPERP